MNQQEPPLAGSFLLGREIGRGTFSRVCLATHSATRRRVAVKVLDGPSIDRAEGVERRVRREIDALRRCRHPHVLRLFDVIEADGGGGGGEIRIVTEYAGGGSLYDRICGKRRPPIEESRRIFQQLICGVEHCHEMGIAHRDLKPENVLWDDRCASVKIGDFGFCGVVPHGTGRDGDGDGDGWRMLTPCGTPHYAAPEVIAGRPYDGRAADAWSCGVILYALLTGTVPFKGGSTPELLRKIARGSYSVPFHVPKLARQLIRGMVEVDPNERMTISEVRAHPWFLTNLPAYLCRSPEEGEDDVLDPEIVDRVTRVPFANVAATRDLVERAAVIRNGDSGDGIVPEELRDLRCAYDILLNEKESYLRAEEAVWSRSYFMSWLRCLCRCRRRRLVGS